MSSSAPTGRQLELTCSPIVTSSLRHRSDDIIVAVDVLAPVVVSVVVAVAVVVSATVPVVETGVSSEAVVVDVGLGVVVML